MVAAGLSTYYFLSFTGIYLDNGQKSFAQDAEEALRGLDDTVSILEHQMEWLSNSANDTTYWMANSQYERVIHMRHMTENLRSFLQASPGIEAAMIVQRNRDVVWESHTMEEDCFVTHCENVEYNQGKYISYIATNPCGEFHTVTSIRFFNEVVPTPTVTAGAECQVNQAAQGEEVVTYEEVFKVKYAGTFTHRLEVAPNVEAQYARHGQQDDCEGADFDGFFTRPFGKFANHTNDVFEYCDYSRECCEEHEQEEQGAPEVTACHGVEYVRQSYEEQTRTAARIYTEAHASREDNQAGGDCYESIQCHNPHRFASQGLVFFNVRTKDCHGTDTQGQGKEGLTHCSEDCFLVNFAEVRQQVEFQTFCTVRKHNGVSCQNYNQNQKASHHMFGNAFYAFLYAQIANAHTSCSHENHVEGHCLSLIHI